MSVHQKKDGRWACVYYDGQKRKWEYFGRGDEAKVSATGRDLEIKLLKTRGQWQTQGQGDNTTFTELCQLYLDTCGHGLAENSRKSILYCLANYALPVISQTPITRINLTHWRQIEAEMVSRKLKAKTINTYFRLISRILTWAIDENEGLLEHHPWAKRKALKEIKFDLELLTIDEIQAMVDHAKPHIAWGIEVAYHTGVRVGQTELFSLKWDDLKLGKAGIRIRPTKTDAPHWQYMVPEFIDRLREERKKTQAKYPDCPWVCHYNGRRMNKWYWGFNAAKRGAGITRRIRPSDLRHYHITYALANGADIHDLAQRVGHKSIQMIVNVYSHLAKDVNRR
jgi:integrase